MTLQEIKDAVNSGKNVYWSQTNYKVVKDNLNQWFIICTNNDHAIGLTHADKITLNGEESEFFMEGE